MLHDRVEGLPAGVGFWIVLDLERQPKVAAFFHACENCCAIAVWKLPNRRGQIKHDREENERFDISTH